MAGLRAEELAASVVAGNRRAAGRVISLIENDAPSAEAIIASLYPHTGNAYVVGITGPTGAGKSTLTDELIRVIRGDGKRVGVIAVDPNSPFSRGAILGDRIRMMRHSGDEDVFIRSMGARGHLGGLAAATQNAILVLDAMGMNVVLVETVGVGQSELEISGTADTTVVVIPPGLGDGVQAIKAGIMEIADIFVVNKGDNPRADRTAADIRELLRMDPDHAGWTPPVVRTVATENVGIEDLWTRIEQHRDYLLRSGELGARRRKRVVQEILDIASARIRQRMLQPRIDTPEFQATIDLVVDRRMSPYEAAAQVAEPVHA